MMKKYLVSLSAICLFHFMANAQAGNGYLLSKEKTQTPDGSMEWHYFYKANGKIDKVIYLQDGKNFYTEDHFVTDLNGQVSSFERKFANGKTPTELHEFVYDKNGVLSHYKYSNGPLKMIHGQPFQSGNMYYFTQDSITVYKGNVAGAEYYSKDIYVLNKQGNITLKRTLNMDNSEIGNTIYYTDYDNHPNPHTLRGNYVNEKIEPVNNGLKQSGLGGDLKPGIIAYAYNTNHLPSQLTVTYDNVKYKIVHTTTYTYTNKTTDAMEAIFIKAKTVGAKSIQAYSYKNEKLYECNNGFYNADGKLIFKRSIKNNISIYEPAIESKELKKVLGHWVLNRNGAFVALRN